MLSHVLAALDLHLLVLVGAMRIPFEEEYQQLIKQQLKLYFLVSAEDRSLELQMQRRAGAGFTED